MIVLIVIDADDKLVEQIEWRLGNPGFVSVFGNHNSKVTVIASNRELEWIRANITGIRMNPSNNVRWIGEDAVFIANSLPRPEELEGSWS